MGDTRYTSHYERIRSARDPAQAMRDLADEEVVQALAAASTTRDPYLANVLATEAMNRMRRSRVITTHLAEGAFALDRELALTFVNPTMARMLGGAWTDYVGRRVGDILELRDLGGHVLPPEASPLGATLQDHATREWDGDLARVGGRAVPVSMHIAPILRDGEADGVVAAFRDVGERRRALEALRDSEERLRSIIEEHPLAVFTLDTSGTVTLVNPAGARTVGHEREALVGATFLPHLPEHERERALANLSDVLEGRTRTDEYEVLHADGALLRMRVTAIPIRVRGEIVGAHCIAEDVGERRRAERALRESEEIHRRLVTAVRDYAISMLSPDGRILTWNDGAERISGWRADEIVGRHLSVLFPEAAARAGAPERELEAAAAAGEHREPEATRRRKDGSLYRASVYLSAMRDDRGKLLGFVKVTRDLTRHLEREAEVRARERQHAVVARLGLRALGGAPLGQIFEEAVEETAAVLGVELTKVLQLDADGQALTLRAGHGWDADVAVGRSQVPSGVDSQAGFTLASNGPVIVRDLVEETRFRGPALLTSHGVRSGMSVVILGPSGPWGVLGIHTRALRAFDEDDANFLQSVANVLANAIARRAAEDELEARVAARTAELEAALRDLDTFASTVSHDLRAPLRGIGYLAQDLTSHADLPEDARALAAHIEREASKATRLVLDILDFSRSRNEILRTEPVDLAPMARELAAEIARQHLRAPPRWVFPESLPVRGDPRLLRVALRNLLENAAKYTSARPDARVEMSGRDEGDMRVVTVADNGIGFAPSDADRLFQPFQRLPGARGHEGMGLGLATVRRVVERHGGRVWAEGEPGRGARFHVALPR